jgi:hypothetical protein
MSEVPLYTNPVHVGDRLLVVKVEVEGSGTKRNTRLESLGECFVEPE